jgi:membrane associated rhomboid family serine protease
VGGLIPLTDASRRPVHFPIVTTGIILTNFFVFALELRGGDAFVLKWAAVAAHITAGHDWITILTAMLCECNQVHRCRDPLRIAIFRRRRRRRRKLPNASSPA